MNNVVIHLCLECNNSDECEIGRWGEKDKCAEMKELLGKWIGSLRKKCFSVDVIEDIIEDTFYNIEKSVSGFRGRSTKPGYEGRTTKFTTWANSIHRNCVANYFRKNKSNPLYKAKNIDDSAAPKPDGYSENFDRAMDLKKMNDIIKKIASDSDDPDYDSAVLFEDYSECYCSNGVEVQALAKKRGLKPNTFTTHVIRAHECLVKRLKEEMGGTQCDC